MKKIIKKSAQNKFNVVGHAIMKYMSEKGWNIMVIEEPLVQKDSGTLKYNFELVFKFTGKKVE